MNVDIKNAIEDCKESSFEVVSFAEKYECLESLNMDHHVFISNLQDCFASFICTLVLFIRDHVDLEFFSQKYRYKTILTK